MWRQLSRLMSLYSEPILLKSSSLFQSFPVFYSKDIFAKIFNGYPFLYPLRMSENDRFSDVFRGYKNG